MVDGQALVSAEELSLVVLGQALALCHDGQLVRTLDVQVESPELRLLDTVELQLGQHSIDTSRQTEVANRS